MTEVSDQTFTNTVVPLDWHAYHHCTFNNVTFVYNGGDVEFKYNEIHGFRIKSENRYVESGMAVLGELGLLKMPMFKGGTNDIVPPGAALR
jgi:hypothetical protein